MQPMPGMKILMNLSSPVEVPFTIKKFCVFLNPALYFSQIPESKNSQITFPDRICIDLLQISNFLMKTFKNL